MTFLAAGGTGAYRFELTRNVSGGVVNELTGAYLAGGTPPPPVNGVRPTDEVTLTDLGCVGSATANVAVVPPMKLRPTSVQVAPGGTFTFSAQDGLGPFTYEMLSNAAGGQVTVAGVYTAPAGGSGRDRVRVRDTGGGTNVDATVDVVAGATLVATEPNVFVPVGSTYRPTFRGGSSFTNGEEDSAAVDYADGLISALAAGSVTVAITDQFTGQQTSLNVTAVPAQTAPLLRAGDQTSVAFVSAPGDVTGDGIPDALLGMIESDLTGVDSGALYLYAGVAGAPNALGATPRQVLGGQGRRDQYGRVVMVADLNGDGFKDLLVSAPLADVGQADAGGVYIHYGHAPGTDAGGGGRNVWSATPDLVIAGRNGSDQLGTSFAVCDFNADGRLDLALGVLLGEDRTLNPQLTDQGGVAIYPGYPDGFLGTPDLTLWGSLPDMAGAWTGSRDLRLGNALAAGDFDGDGACDLAVGSLQFRLTGRNNDGAVFLYKGIAAATGTGVLQPLPSLAWGGITMADGSTQAGRYLAMGDVNGDLKADLVVSQYLHDFAANKTDVGAVRLFLGTDLPTLPPMALAPVDAADWTYEGPNAGDNLAWWVTVADANGDGRLDVVTGNLSGENPDAGAANAGSVTVFHGVQGALPGPAPNVTHGGAANGDRFGQNAAVLGDVDVDGTPDLLVLAARRDDYGVDVGTPYYVPGDVARPRVQLEMPAEAAGQQLGRGFDLVGDVNGDNRMDLVVGAPQDDPAAGINAGAAYLYLGQMGGGFSAAPDVTLAGHLVGLTPASTVLHSGSDQFGYAVSRAGDFNGDGVADFAVVARSEDRPATYSANLAPDGMCAGTRNDAGAVYVYLGKSNGLPSATPAFVYFGPQGGQVIETVAGGLDVNKDGRDDLLVGSLSWDSGMTTNTGGFAVVFGRAEDATNRTVVICAEDLLWLGLAANDGAGRSLAPVGDLNTDGCDDFAVGSAGEDLGRTDQGSVRVVYGWGGTGCPANPQAVLLIPDVASAQAGFSVGGHGVDVDGDAVPDLAVGGIGLRNGANTTGGAWLVPGAYINSLAKVTLAETVVANAHVLVDPARMGTFLVLGTVVNERAGSGVDLVAGVIAGNRGALAVGSPNATVSGATLAGAVRIHRFVTMPVDQRGFTGDPLGVVGGETTRPGSLLGERVRSMATNNRAWVAVGAWEGSGAGVDHGTAYVVSLPRP